MCSISEGRAERPPTFAERSPPSGTATSTTPCSPGDASPSMRSMELRHPMLKQLRTQPRESLRWLVGATVMEAGELDLTIAMALDDLPSPEKGGDTERRTRDSWGRSGAQLADALGRSANDWPDSVEIQAEYLRLYELRNRLVHGLHFINGDADGLLVESVHPVSNKRCEPADTKLETSRWDLASIYKLYCDLETLRHRVAQPITRNDGPSR